MPYFELNTYILDIFIDIAPNYNIKIIDFNQWAQQTSPCLYSYEELD